MTESSWIAESVDRAATSEPVRDAEEILLGFTVALRAAGVPVTPDRAQSYLAAAALAGLDDATAAYHAGRATLCASPADLERLEHRVVHVNADNAIVRVDDAVKELVT